MPRSVPARIRPVARGFAAAAVAVVLATALIALSRPIPVALAATQLLNGAATPSSGTTATTFVISVNYVSAPEARPAVSVTVEIVGLGGPSPMTLVSGSDTDGTWRTSTMLPPGAWDLVFAAIAQGEDPPSLAGPTLVVTAGPTPTPGPTPPATPVPTSAATATPRPTSAPTPLPPGVTPQPTPRPTPLPPGVTPAPATPGTAPGDPPASEAATSGEPQAAGEPSGGPASSMDPEATNGSVGPSASGSALPEDDDDDGSSGGGGVGRLGWIVLGGMTSAAGAFVLVRQWRARPRG